MSGGSAAQMEDAVIDSETLLDVLLHQRENRVGDSVYKMVQCDFAYNSNRMEGSRLTPEQTRMVFGRKEISGEGIPLDDILEAMNHFEAFDAVLDRSGDYYQVSNADRSAVAYFRASELVSNASIFFA